MPPKPKVMPKWLRLMNPSWVQAVTIPPFGIYIKPDNLTNLSIIAHENIHWMQYERMGLMKFWLSYWWGLLRYGYKNHPMEIEARAVKR